MDAIDLLKQQHREVDGLFERIEREALEGEPRALLLARIAEKLTIHAQIEEQHFYPFARSAGIQDLVEHSTEEHAKVKKMLADMLRTRQDDPKLGALCQELKTNVQHHVQEEETKLFPQLQSVVSRDQLDDVGERMHDAAQRLAQKDVLTMAETHGSLQR
jgi:hemerythrin superfamily protein